MSIIKITLSEDHIEGTQATVNQWLCSEGDSVQKNQPIIELETDKVMMEVIAPESGTINKIFIQESEVVESNAVLGLIDTDEVSNSAVKAKQKPDTNNLKTPKLEPTSHNTIANLSTASSVSSHTLLSPSVRRLSQKNDIDLSLIQGTGKNNRVTTRDLMGFINSDSHNKSEKSGLSQHIPISSMRKNIANHMVESLLHKAPHVTSVFNLDMSSIIKHRKLNKQNFADAGVKLTFTAYFIAAATKAIHKVPIINSQLHDESIEIFNYINIGVGTALADKGLIVPVIKNCQDLNLMSIATELSHITDKARNNKLSPIDVQNGTFTISNHGVSGSLLATPIIINQPQSAILGIGKMEKRVVVEELDDNDVLSIKPMCYVSLTIDHRVLDAHQTNLFLSHFVEILEGWK
ncbi:MAG: dihydrolipoamide acetyltransferase family protein [Marinicellaceae bacterium]